MVLDQLTDGASRLLSVLDMDEGAKRLVFILCLPLVDGVFATLLVTGAVETFSDIVAVALTVFTGAGALAVMYSHSDSKRQAQRLVFQASVPLLVGACLVALVAPVYEQLFHLQRLRYTAGLVLLVIAGHLAQFDLMEKFSAPAVILTGLVLSVRNPGSLSFSLGYLQPALMTALTATLGLYLATYLSNRRMNLSYVRRGAAFVLVTISMSMFGIGLPSELGLMVFAASLAVSLKA